MKVLLSVDGSEYTRRILDYVESKPDLLGSRHEYTLFTVVAPLPVHAARHIDRATIDDYYKDQADDVLKAGSQLAATPGWKLRIDSRIGHASDVIAEYAQAGGFDLIVMGTQGSGALASMLLGSVTRGVLARCTVPLLLVR